MAELLFYQKPTFLNREIHKTLKFSTSSDYSFTSKVNSVPVTGIEFFEVSRDMPVLFSRDGKGNFFPLALLSLMKEGHQHVDQAGGWHNSYIPAFVRCYPFALTDKGTVCFDEKSGQLNEEQGEPLFDEKGESSDALKNVIHFLNNYDQQYKNTIVYCEALKELELLKPFNLQVLIDKDNPLRLEGLFVIDEKKLAELPDEKIKDWFRTGWLAWSYAHLHSLGVLNRMVRLQK